MPANTLPQLLARARARAPVWAALMRLDRPIGTLLLLWPTLWSLWIAARGVPDPGVLLVFVAGVTVMRAAGCVINDYADRHFDALVERTRQRPFATGKVGTGEALGLFAVLAAIAFALVLTQNALTIQLSFVGLALAVIYPFMKRHTWVPQLFLGAAFGWGIPMAYAAEAGSLDRFAWLLFIANLLWTVAYDTWYAMVDRPDDIKVGIRSTAILFGSADRAIIAALQAAALLTLVLVGRGIEAGWPYWLGLAGAAGTFAWQRHITASRQRSSYFAAFLHNNWSGAVVFAGIAADFALRGAAAG